MENVIESEKAERDDVCGCEGGPRLSVLKDVQKAYEERIEVIHRVGGPKKLQKQVQVLESWVSDLVAQNTLLAQTVEELETEVTSRLLIERRKHAEQNRNKTICDKLNEMKMINDSLKIENVSKEREIRRLNKDMQQYEQTTISLRNDLSKSKYYTPDVIKKDAEVSTDISCCGQQECGDIEPVKEVGVKQEDSEDIKRRAKSLLALRQENVSLRHELHAMQGVLTALYEQCNVAELRTKFKDEVILEMRRQLRQAKVKLKEVTESRLSLQKEQDNEFKPSSYHSSNATCVQQQPRRKRRVRPNMDLNINWESRDMYESGDDVSSKD